MGKERKTGYPRQIKRVGVAGGVVLAAGMAFAGLHGADAAGGRTGDVNCDGRTNSIDAALVLQRTAGLTGSLPCEQAGDVNYDDILTAVDAALILQNNAGLINLPPKPTATNTPTRTPTRTPTETPTATPTPEITPGPNNELAKGITELINQERQRLGLNLLNPDPALVSAANEYAELLFDRRPLPIDHNVDGLTPTQRAEKYGWQGGWVGDILESVGGAGKDEADYFTPEKFMQGWINSPGHYSNIIDPAYSYIGVGCYQGPDNFPDPRPIVILISICAGNLGRPSDTPQ